MTYSFDVFDTCLIRKCGRPEVVFEILAERILGKDADKTQLCDFVLIRKKGESEAIKANKQTEEIVIDNIYEKCDFSELTDVSNDIIKQTELQIEKEQLVAVYSIKSNINQLREKYGRVIYISDMYLPQSFVKEILTEQGLFIGEDKLFVSSEYGVKKSTGNLFHLVKEKMNLRYNRWTHSGDNKYSDICVPRKLGIKTQHISHNYSYYEKEWFSQIPVSLTNYKGRCASFSRSIRLMYEKSPYVEFAADFIAPLYVSYISYLLKDAKTKGIKNLFFLARDGYIYYNIAQILLKDYPNIHVHYIYASRKALYLPGLEEINEDNIRNLILGERLINILDGFQLEKNYSDFSQYDKLSGKELISSLIKDDRFISIVKEKQKVQKGLLLQYLIDMGVHKENSAIVDLNGTRNCHKIICKILKAAGYNTPYGYFFTLNNNHIIGSDYKVMVLNENLENYNRFVCSLPPVMMLEEYFNMANHSSTISYSINDAGHVVPVFGEDTIDIRTKDSIFSVNKEVCQTYARMYQKYIDKSVSQDICFGTLSIIAAFVNAPSYHLLKIFEHLTFSWTPVLKVKMLKKGSIFSLLKNKRQSVWFIGEFVYRFPFHNLATRLFRLIFYYRKMKYTF